MNPRKAFEEALRKKSAGNSKSVSLAVRLDKVYLELMDQVSEILHETDHALARTIVLDVVRTARGTEIEVITHRGGQRKFEVLPERRDDAYGVARKILKQVRER